MSATNRQYIRGGQQIASGLGNYYGNSGLSDAGSALGILGGVQRGGVSGYGSAAANAGRIAGNLYGSKALGAGAGALGNVLGIYQGLQQGGVSGYGGAAVNAAALAGVPGVGYVAAPLALYNFGKGWKSGATGADALSGAETGAEIGTYFGPLGTLAGGVIGGAAGALSSAFGPGAKDPETYAVQNIIDATSKNKNNPAVAASVDNPYLGLAGLMDRRSSTLPEYAQYGRMGEQKFTNDLVSQINTAAKANPALAKDPNAMYSQVISPWVNKMGSGYSAVGPEYAATNQGLLQDMTKQYMSGTAEQAWKPVGGQDIFSDAYKDSPFAGAQQTYMQQLAQQQAQQQALQHQQTQIARASPYGASRHGVQMRAKGGKIQSKLQKLYEGSFANRARHYDEGGYVDYASYTAPNAITEQYTPPTPDYSQYENPTLQDPTQSSGGIWDQTDLDKALAGSGNIVNQQNDPYAYGDGSSKGSSVFGAGGVLSGLGNLLGVNSTGQLIQKYGALAPILAAALGGNKPASAPATPAGYGAIPSIPTPSFSRAYTPPKVDNWYTYGQGPEQSFLSNNQLPSVSGVSPPSAAPQAPPQIPLNPGQMNTQPVPSGPTARPMLRARGGTAFDSTQGHDYVPDPGHGDGTSDDIDAKLSGGEYVMDAGTVSMLGNGSNEAGARALDQLRKRVRQHAGKHLVKGKQFMKAKPAEAYLRGEKE